MKIVEQGLEESDAYSLFLYAFRSPVTKDCYLRRMKIFFNYINLLPNRNLEEQCNLFAAKGLEVLIVLIDYVAGKLKKKLVNSIL
jgi:hypothetical protein